MNCKPGDLAVFVRGPNCGRLVRVIGEPWIACMPPPSWDCEALSEMWDRRGRQFVPAGVVGEAEDSYLRPIRDPGEGARDETLAWKRVPSPKVAA